jgi:hypothetical protein
MHTLRTLSYASFLGLALSSASCGKDSAPTTAPTQSHEAGGKPATDAQVKLSHFSTTDGMVGFTLDRSGAPIKLQVDGDKDIVELTQQEVRDEDDGELLGYELVDPTNTVRILIGKGGGITFLRGKDELPATADKAAKPLGAPTIKGPPVVEPAETPAYM